MNTELAETVTALDGVLAATLDVDNYFDLDQLYRPAHPGRLAVAEPPPVEAAFLPPPPKGVSRMMGGAARHELRAVGQGYADGLAGLARDFGVDVA